MADVAIKSIKFPGLDDTYVFLQNDNTLSVAGKAADAKATGDAIAATKAEYFTKGELNQDFAFGDDHYTVMNGYIRNSGMPNPGCITSSGSYRTSYFRAKSDGKLYVTAVKDGRILLRVSTEQPVFGTVAYTGTLYDSNNQEIPTENTKLSFTKGKYIAIYQQDNSYTIHVEYDAMDELQADIPLTAQMQIDVEKINEGPADYLDGKINREHLLVDYDYGSEKTVEPGSLDVERYRTQIKVSYTGSSGAGTKRIRLSGDVFKSTGDTVYKTWKGIVQLVEGKKYGVRIRQLSGTATVDGNAYLAGVHIYESQGTSTIASVVSETINERVYSFTAPAGKINVALAINEAAVLSNAVYDVTMFEDESESDVLDYYVAELADTVAKVRNETSEPAIVFPWITDEHRYSSNAAGVQNFGNAIQNLKAFARRVPCDFVLNTGDLTDGNQTQSVTLGRAYECLEMFREVGVPYLWAQGNHDTNYAGTQSGDNDFTLAECYKAYFTATKAAAYNFAENGTDYYIDFDAVGVRMVVINANNVSEGRAYAFGSGTATWLADALDTDKKVLLAVHQSPISTQVYENQATTGAADIVSAINTFIAGGGDIIMLSGHCHRDVAFISPWLAVVQDCQRFNDVSETYADTESEITGNIDAVIKNARAQYQASEDLWSVCVYKPNSDEIDIIRFGAGVDRYFHAAAVGAGTLTSRFGESVSWSTSDSTVATVSGGVVTGVASGTCAILAKDASGNYECWKVVIE